VQVGVAQGADRSARPATVAGRLVRLIAENQLRQPQSEALLSNPCRSGEQKNLGQLPLCHGIGEPAAQALVPD
jgi:hypothetical protein